MVYFEKGGPELELGENEIRAGLQHALDRLGPRNKVVAVPPDITRLHSQAGLITRLVWDYYGEHLTDVLPALGTHHPMTPGEIGRMFGGIPGTLFRVHDWRKDVVTLGEVPGEYVGE
ncbi:MAG: D-mannonate epimerase, partial [Bacteroidetes bacterium]